MSAFDVRSLFELKGRRVLVTGAGSGLGAVIAQAFGQLGARIILAGRTVHELEHVRDLITATGGEAHVCRFDARSRESCESLFQSVVRDLGGLDVAVVNHGVGHGRAAEDVSEEEWAQVLDTNVNGCFRCAQLAGRQMLTQTSGGSIIVVGSTAGVVAFPNLLTYATSKAAALQIVRQLAVEWGDRGIRVNAVCPGYMTHMMKGTADRYSGADIDEWVLRTTPLRRRGEPVEIVGAAIYLATAASSYVTGQVLTVDGGYTLL